MSMLISTRRVAILGGGITGLTAAWHLLRAGFSPIVFEQSARTGGVIAAMRRDGWLHELGPNSLLESSPEVANFIDELGLGSRRLYASPGAKQRYIVRFGRLMAMPASPLGFVTTKLFSTRAKLTLLAELLRARRTAHEEESVADFVVRRLGREFLDYAVAPFVGGVYAGDPARLSIRHAFPKLHALEQEHGSLIRGAWKRRNTSGAPKGRIFSFPDGLIELPRALANFLGGVVQLHARIRGIRRTERGWEIICENRDCLSTEAYAAVVSTLPADALAALSFEGVPEAHRLAILSEIEHPPVASVFTGYRDCDVRHPLDGFGVLMPEVEHRPILGTLFSSRLFPERAPEGCVGLTSFVGGTRNHSTASLSEAELIQIVQAELSRLIGVRNLPVFTHVHTWHRAIPQYTLGYQRYHDAIAAVEAAAPGFLIGGNCRDGISLANCIASGRRLAEAVFRLRE